MYETVFVRWKLKRKRKQHDSSCLFVLYKYLFDQKFRSIFVYGWFIFYAIRTSNNTTQIAVWSNRARVRRPFGTRFVSIRRGGDENLTVFREIYINTWFQRDTIRQCEIFSRVYIESRWPMKIILCSLQHLPK